MPPKGHRRRREPHRHHHQSRRPEHPAEQSPLIAGLRSALRSPDPVDLLEVVSAIFAALDPDSKPTSRSTLPSITEAFIGSPLAETTAALTVISSLTTDDALGEAIDEELGRRRHPMPGWLARLNEARVEPDVWFLTHVQGDGDDYLLGLVTATGEPVTALVYVDHNLGSIVKDAFLISAPLEEVVIEMGLRLEANDQKLTKVDPADARAAVEAAIEAGLRDDRPLDSETWPGCRAAVEWMLRMLPEGGQAPTTAAWSDDQAEDLALEFLASDLATELDGESAHSLVGPLIEFGRTFVTRDPLTWSSATVEMVMEWFPRAVPAPADAMHELPDLLRAFIRFADARKGVREGLTAETVAAVADWEPLFHNAIKLRDSTTALELVQGWHTGEVDSAVAAPIFLAGLARTVGGLEALNALHTKPLPAEEFDWDGVAEDIRPGVAEILAALDGCADELLDLEHRTAMRRLLARAVRSEPGIVRRASKHARTASAVAWLVCSANDTLGQYARPLMAKDLAAWFGLASAPADKVEVLLKAIGVNPYERYGAVVLETPDLLVSTFRAMVIERRDRWLAAGSED